MEIKAQEIIGIVITLIFIRCLFNDFKSIYWKRIKKKLKKKGVKMPRIFRWAFWILLLSIVWNMAKLINPVADLLIKKYLGGI